MESTQAEHLKLSDDEIKLMICSLTTEVHKIKNIFLNTIEEVEDKIYLLKRHFCPEKFAELKVPIDCIKDLVDFYYEKDGEIVD